MQNKDNDEELEVSPLDMLFVILLMRLPWHLVWSSLH